MGFWSGIKHALNSTLGTSEFKPLDKIIEGQRTLAASDSVIKVLLSTSQNISSSQLTVGSFTPQVDGSVRISGKFTLKSLGSASSTLVLRVYLGTSQVALTSVNLTNTQSEYTAIRDLSVTKGNTYVVKVSSDSGMTANSVNVCANVIDTSLVE